MRILPRPVAGTRRRPIVTLAQLRAQVRVDDNVDDLILAAKLEAATGHIERAVGRALAPIPLRATFEAWPTGCADTLTLLVPVNSVDAITYTDAGGAAVAWTGFVARTSAGGTTRVRPAATSAWPALGTDSVVTLDATGGYIEPPAALIEAVCLLAGHFYANREATGDDSIARLPFGIADLVRPHRWSWLG